jgi:alanyl-tRNA synthetase
MNSADIRHKFLDFFRSKEHEIVPSAPLVVKDDPTLMFTNAGMNQFKDFFLGNKVSTSKRIADTQKCLRVSGKHNDLEEVGIDTYHHTMFEMLGNWSFGDYFKKEAIEWAWELLTKEFGLDEDRLYATVFGGDEKEGLEADKQAYDFWKKILPEDRIIFCGKKDNFWEMGETGPCGPCSEIHIDIRPEKEIESLPGKELVNKDHPLVIEIWNLVFIQFNRLANSKLENLPEKHVDTGMGFERLAMAVQAKTSNYDTDVFQPLISYVGEIANVEYGKDEKTDIAQRVIVDHIRAVSFAISDGQLPGNTGAGYVIRRILRRAVRYGYTFLNLSEPFLNKLISPLSDQFKDVFPEINKQKNFIEKVILEEETSFLRTLENGLKRIDSIISSGNIDNKEIPGVVAFELYDTFGFPLDLTSLIARENGYSIDEKAFEIEMEKQKTRSKADAAKEEGDWISVQEGESEFVGYDSIESSARILKHRTVKKKNKSLVQVVLDRTPFYAESGGQVGDTGVLKSDSDAVRVLDTKKENDLIVHFIEKLPGKLDDTFTATVDRDKRLLTMNNHSATHLMHAALRQVLGNHVEQRGSFVNSKLLRFDFSHFGKMTDEEIKAVEDIVNNRIRENIPLDVKLDVPIDKAKEMGAMALFGEKYGDSVRVITFNPEYSVELCGGTHVPATGNIGFFKIISESSIAAGIRRIEAVTAVEAEGHVFKNELIVKQVNSLLNEPKDVASAICNLQDEKKALEKELQGLINEQAGRVKKELLNEVENNDGISVIISRVGINNANEIKNLAFQLKKQVDDLFLVLGAVINDKPQLTVMISESLVKEKGLNAGTIIRDLASEIKGGGGGQAFYATAGGKDVNGLDKALDKARELIKV